MEKRKYFATISNMKQTLQEQAREWVNQREELCKWRSELSSQGGPIMSLKPEAIDPERLPESLQAEVIRQLEAIGSWS